MFTKILKNIKKSIPLILVYFIHLTIVNFLWILGLWLNPFLVLPIVLVKGIYIIQLFLYPRALLSVIDEKYEYILLFLWGLTSLVIFIFLLIK